MVLKKYDNMVTSTRKNCSQMFFIYTGAFQNVAGMSPLDFLQQTGLANRNFIVFRDPYRVAFRRGISEEVNDFPALLDWQTQYLADLPHVKEIYCLGVSAGGIPAILSGHHHEAKTVWSFGARPPVEDWATEYDRQKTRGDTLLGRVQLYGKKLARKLRMLTKTPAKAPFRIGVVDTELIKRAAEDLKAANGKTEYRLYYIPSNLTDVYVHGFLKDSPGAVSMPIEPPPDYPHMYEPGWDHLVLPVLKAKGDLKDLFPPFASA